MQLPLFHINRDIVFQLMPQSISCHTLKFAELRGEYEYIVLFIKMYTEFEKKERIFLF